jgi:hypothetical protein
MRGEVLLAANRPDDAFGWFASLIERTPCEVIYRAVVAQRQL